MSYISCSSILCRWKFLCIQLNFVIHVLLPTNLLPLRPHDPNMIFEKCPCFEGFFGGFWLFYYYKFKYYSDFCLITFQVYNEWWKCLKFLELFLQLDEKQFKETLFYSCVYVITGFSCCKFKELIIIVTLIFLVNWCFCFCVSKLQNLDAYFDLSR